MTTDAVQIPRQTGAAVMAPVVSPVDHVSLGQALTDAGLTPDKISGLMARIEQLSAQAAESVALGVARAIAEDLQAVHTAAAMDVYAAITAQGANWLHRNCAGAALNVANRRPRTGR